jgi:predicted ATP-binding protein involved in virulence
LIKRGFIIRSTITKAPIPLPGLSSGEQHLLVLYFQLLFGVKPNAIVLIDEPEISLHISWQKEFLNDLIHFSKFNNLTAVIATHSPDIISNYWELAKPLKS